MPKISLVTHPNLLFNFSGRMLLEEKYTKMLIDILRKEKGDLKPALTQVNS